MDKIKSRVRAELVSDLETAVDIARGVEPGAGTVDSSTAAVFNEIRRLRRREENLTGGSMDLFFEDDDE
jgi:hypothetical protein